MSPFEDPISEPVLDGEDEFYLSPARLARLSTRELFLSPLRFPKKGPTPDSGQPDSKASQCKAG